MKTMDAESYIGQKFGRLTVVAVAAPVATKTTVECLCSCGARKALPLTHLRNGNTRSCGCLQREASAVRMGAQSRTHGESKTRLYKTWLGMVERCNHIQSKDRKNYGGRGITIGWGSYEEFRKDMKTSYLRHVKAHGEKQTQIDRIDVDGNYSRINCRWVTPKQQGHNRRNNRKYTYRNQTLTIAGWAEKIGCSRQALRYRLNKGWPVGLALTVPFNHGNGWKKYGT